MPTSDLSAHLARVAATLDARTGEDSPIRPALRARILRFLQLTRSAIYPKIFGDESTSERESLLSQAAEELKRLLCEALPDGTRHSEILFSFFDSLPTIADMLDSDVQAAYEGDPAARTTEEIMLSYPAFEAISIYRIAHVLYTLGVPLIPRMMTEHVHKNTGIDIHPGATIGKYFFIDHGTGVVIGETCRIGEHVKLYQGVTLGAKSFELDENGNPVKGIKRHPDIGNHVIVYANATILGGGTVVGDRSVIGGNVWLIHSVPEDTKLYYQGK